MGPESKNPARTAPSRPPHKMCQPKTKAFGGPIPRHATQFMVWACKSKVALPISSIISAMRVIGLRRRVCSSVGRSIDCIRTRPRNDLHVLPAIDSLAYNALCWHHGRIDAASENLDRLGTELCSLSFHCWVQERCHVKERFDHCDSQVHDYSFTHAACA